MSQPSTARPLRLHERIDLAVARALPLIRLSVAETDSIARHRGRR